MFAQELLLAHETTEDGKNDDSVVNAIQLEWIGQAPLDTSRANIMAVDGTIFRCQDSEDNAQAFGFISQKHKSYPQLCLVGLMATETRLILSNRWLYLHHANNFYH